MRFLSLLRLMQIAELIWRYKMSPNWKYIETKLEIGFVFLCYAIGMGSILFGSLSGSKYGYHFIIIGVLALILVIIHTSRRAAKYNENIVTKGEL